jgi:hypothetical protein
MQIKITVMLLFAGVIAGTFIGLSFTEDTVTYVSEVKSEEQIIEERIDMIYNSVTFQNEMRKLATARALYELSNETQNNAVKLSEKALATYQESKTLEQEWHNQK